jgi:hypothetical protein
VIGNQVGVGGEQLDVVGVGGDVTAFGGQTVVAANIDDVRRLIAPDDAELASMIVIRGEAPNLPDGLVRFDRVATERDVLAPVADRVSSLQRQQLVLWAIGGGLMGLGGWWLGRKRRRDFGVSKSYGVPARDIFASLVVQCAAMGFVAMVGGIGIAIIFGRAGSAPFHLTSRLGLLCSAGVIAGTVIGSLAGLGHIFTAQAKLPFDAADIARHQPVLV